MALKNRSNLLSEIGKKLECPICCEIFTDPKMLPCSHTYCWNCIEALKSKPPKSKKSIACPQCRTDIDKKDVAKLPSDIVAGDMVKLLQQFEEQVVFPLMGQSHSRSKGTKEAGIVDVLSADDCQIEYGCYISGYSMDELKVELKGDELVISGDHKRQRDDYQLCRTFTSRIVLPDDLVKDAIQCVTSDDAECLLVQAKRRKVEPSAAISIPIQPRPSIRKSN